MFTIQNCSNQKIFKFEKVQIRKKFILKSSKFEKSSHFKKVHFFKSSKFKKCLNLKKFKFRNGSKIKKVQNSKWFIKQKMFIKK